MADTRLSLFAVSPPGLEHLTRAELFALGINQPRAVPGGVEFEGFLSHLYRVNLCSRTASRVLVRAGEFYAAAFEELHRKASALPWEKFLRPGAPVTVRATCHKSKLYHSDGVAERVADAMHDRLGPGTGIEPQPSKEGRRHKDRKEEINTNLASFAPPAPLWGSRLENASPTGIVVRLDHDLCTLSLDSSGEHLHKRGYRLATAKAPLRETIAAALLLHAAYDPARPLLDPFCGAGTFAIEAALMARNIAPGLHRRFAFIDWVNFDTQEWGEQLKRARAGANDSAPAIFASDRDEGAVAAATANAARAGVAANIQWRVCPLSAIEPPPGPGLLIGNLPYGKRVGDSPRNLYAQFGKIVRAKFSNWRVGILAGNMSLAQATGLDFESPLILENGGLKVPFVQTPQT
ncbi:MAG: class I SAM-dependent RNA methyltransferase [Chloroflexi bacterium]|nr:class I SAM-dependent RNA methyltransferase [Chloroflexota bacterium]